MFESLLKKNFWQSLFTGTTGSGRTKFTFEELRALSDVLNKNQVVTEANRALVVETIRSIAEFMIWGDQNEPRIFDYFLENNVMHYLHRVLQQPSNRTGDVAKQVLQTLSIIIQNIRSETGTYFLFSNNHINNIVEIRFDFEDEEVLGYYISFLKTISLKLNPRTVQFFFDRREGAYTFPLYSEAVKFAHHKEGMVRAGVRTLTLNVYSVSDPYIQEYVCRPPATVYFAEMASYIADQVKILDKRMAAAEGFSAQVLSSLDSQLAEVEDMVSYVADILTTAHPKLSHVAAQQLWVSLVGPYLLRPLLEYGVNKAGAGGTGPRRTSAGGAPPSSPGRAAPQVRAACSLYCLERLFVLITYPPLLNNLAIALLDPRVGHPSCRPAFVALLRSEDHRAVPAALRCMVALVHNRHVAPEVMALLGLVPRLRSADLHTACVAGDCAACRLREQLPPLPEGCPPAGTAPEPLAEEAQPVATAAVAVGSGAVGPVFGYHVLWTRMEGPAQGVGPAAHGYGEEYEERDDGGAAGDSSYSEATGVEAGLLPVGSVLSDEQEQDQEQRELPPPPPQQQQPDLLDASPGESLAEEESPAASAVAAAGSAPAAVAPGASDGSSPGMIHILSDTPLQYSIPGAAETGGKAGQGGEVTGGRASSEQGSADLLGLEAGPSEPAGTTAAAGATDLLGEAVDAASLGAAGQPPADLLGPEPDLENAGPAAAEASAGPLGSPSSLREAGGGLLDNLLEPVAVSEPVEAAAGPVAATTAPAVAATSGQPDSPAAAAGAVLPGAAVLAAEAVGPTGEAPAAANAPTTSEVVEVAPSSAATVDLLDGEASTGGAAAGPPAHEAPGPGGAPVTAASCDLMDEAAPSAAAAPGPRDVMDEETSVVVAAPGPRELLDQEEAPASTGAEATAAAETGPRGLLDEGAPSTAAAPGSRDLMDEEPPAAVASEPRDLMDEDAPVAAAAVGPRNLMDEEVPSPAAADAVAPRVVDVDALLGDSLDAGVGEAPAPAAAEAGFGDGARTGPPAEPHSSDSSSALDATGGGCSSSAGTSAATTPAADEAPLSAAPSLQESRFSLAPVAEPGQHGPESNAAMGTAEVVAAELPPPPPPAPPPPAPPPEPPLPVSELAADDSAAAEAAAAAAALPCVAHVRPAVMSCSTDVLDALFALLSMQLLPMPGLWNVILLLGQLYPRMEEQRALRELLQQQQQAQAADLLCIGDDPLTTAAAGAAAVSPAADASAAPAEQQPPPPSPPHPLDPSSTVGWACELSAAQRESLRCASVSAASAVLDEVGGMWCDALVAMMAMEWPAAHDAVSRAVLRTGAEQLMGGPHLYPRQHARGLSGAARNDQGLSGSAVAALHSYHAVARMVALLLLHDLLQKGAVERQPPPCCPLPPGSEVEGRELDVLEGQEVELQAGSAIPCIVSFSPGQERRVYFAAAGPSLRRLADYLHNPQALLADPASQAVVLHSSPAVVLADPAPTRLNAGIVLSVSPLLGSDPSVDKAVAKWLHVHVRPSVRGLLRLLRSAAGGRKGGLLGALRHLVDGHWVLAFPDAERAGNARQLVEQSAHRLRALYCELLSPVLSTVME